MIILDTNVISGLMEARPDSVLLPWLNHTRMGSLWITSIAVFEIKGGIDSLDDSRRKTALLHAFDQFLDLGFRDRVAPLDHQGAIAAATIGATREKKGRPAGIADTLMAGIAVSRDAAIVTRNVRHFNDLQLQLINPWAKSR